MGAREVQTLLALSYRFDIDVMVRPPTTERTRLYRYLEDGAAGLMIPFVSTVEKAMQLVEAVKFPPIGNRGIDGAGMDGDFQVGRGIEYTQHANQETFLVGQIETPQAVENVDAICSVAGLDGLFIGPADLGLRLEVDGQTEMSIQDAQIRVNEACQTHGKFWGQPSYSPEHLKELTKIGARLVCRGADFGAIIADLKASSAAYDAIEK